MGASGRREVASDVKFAVGASFIELYIWFKFGDPSSYGVQTATATTDYAAYAINAFANSLGSGVKNGQETCRVNDNVHISVIFHDSSLNIFLIKWS